LGSSLGTGANNASAEMTAGRKVVVFLTDPTKATDAVVIAVHT
jgi:hypothetical protein